MKEELRSSRFKLYLRYLAGLRKNEWFYGFLCFGILACANGAWQVGLLFAIGFPIAGAAMACYRDHR